MNILKYFKALLYIFVPILVFSIILSIFYYFNLIGSNMLHYLQLFITAISMLVGGIYIGSKAVKKGWLEGIKIGLEVVIILFILSYLAFDQSLHIKTIIYYLVLIISSMLGSMIGINNRKTN